MGMRELCLEASGKRGQMGQPGAAGQRGNRRRRGSMGGLLYREFLIARKQIFLSYAVSLLIMIFTLLVQLSCKIGNLSFLLDEKLKGFLINEANLLAVLYSFGSLDGVVGAALLEEKDAWKHFCHSTPVGAVRITVAKYFWISVLYFTSVLLGSVFLAVSNRIAGRGYQSFDAGAVLLSGAVFMFLEISTLVFLQLTHSRERAGILSMVVILAVLFPIVRKVRVQVGDMQDMLNLNPILELVKKAIPYSVLVTAAVFVTGFCCSVILYRRREK